MRCGIVEQGESKSYKNPEKPSLESRSGVKLYDDDWRLIMCRKMPAC